MPDPLLRMTGVSKRFGATHALRDVALEVNAGEVLALIGENGAGKSTLMKVLSGAVPPDSGSMQISGQPYAPRSPHSARLAGVAMIYQELNLAPDLSVEDNIMLGQETGRWGILRRDLQRQRVRDVLDQLGHPELQPDTLVNRLSVGAQQLVEIARALVMEARIIVFDEPTSSLARHDVERLFGVIARLKETGIGIVYISHFLDEVREICDHYTVLRDGCAVGSGSLEKVSESEIVALMVGRTVDELFPSVPHTPGDVVLSLSRLSGSAVPTDVTLDLRRGEILGVAGLVGAGRTELLRCIFGLDPVKTGTVKVGQFAPRRRPSRMIAAGLGLVSEDRKGEGLAQSRSIADNMTYSRLQPYRTVGFLHLRRRRQAVSQWMRKLKIKAQSQEQSVENLSGGNQQKVAIARVLHQDADVLLLDEPTRGIDVGTKAEIYRLMGESAAAGKAILFVSSYLTELLAVCDRVAVMSRGRVCEVRPSDKWTEETAMAVAVAGESI
ncbi:MAG: sugar ABC transporter ATP-binding protein [Planctomycetaceae bacterium]|jgi:ribose transport system ATP-binding protein|nr:sugar ABC transporter ATP-binding protein [Planctomycetaceae bacterium]MBT6485013.1 sugar ABC transporter ATP-binding protein [Planctomycetaceae bacterium]MBT6497501.1 sugar ABC transporter ATP-binding protein [Planctomycetaceae bacterium]